MTNKVTKNERQRLIDKWKCVEGPMVVKDSLAQLLPPFTSKDAERVCKEKEKMWSNFGIENKVDDND